MADVYQSAVDLPTTTLVAPRPRRRPSRPSPSADLVRALVDGAPEAPAELFDRYAQHLQRVLSSVLGPDPELADLLHDVFAEALRCIHRLQDGGRLKAWLTAIAVHTARGMIRRRVRRRWVRCGAAEEVPLPPSHGVAPETRQAVRGAYRVLDRLPANLRLAFALRHIEGMRLVEVAQACNVSLATIKRRLARAEARFVALAQQEPTLRAWLAESRRFSRVRPST